MTRSLERRNITWSKDLGDLCSNPTVAGIRMVPLSYGRLYIEPRYFYDQLRTRGLKRRRNDWVNDNIKKLSLIGVPEDHIIPGTKADGCLGFDVLSTLAFVIMLVEMFNGGNKSYKTLQECAMITLAAIADHSFTQLKLDSELPPIFIDIDVDDLNIHVRLTVDRVYGRVQCWGDILNYDPDIVEFWDECVMNSHLGADINSDYNAPLFTEAVTFTAAAMEKLPASNRLLVAVQSKLVYALARLFERRIVELERANTLATSLPPVLRATDARASQIDPFVMYSLLERARDLGSVPRLVLRFNSDRAEYLNLSATGADKWWLKELCMYNRNLQVTFSCIIRFPIAMDPSTYNGEETLISQVYSSKIDKSANCMLKIIPKGRNIGVDEFPMSDLFAAIVLQRRHLRYAAFKEIRALSSQIADITGGVCIYTSIRQSLQLVVCVWEGVGGKPRYVGGSGFGGDPMYVGRWGFVWGGTHACMCVGGGGRVGMGRTGASWRGIDRQRGARLPICQAL